MSRCKACDIELTGVNHAHWRDVTLETGKVIRIMEDLCSGCRNKVFQYSDPEDFDLIDGLGWDAEDG